MRNFKNTIVLIIIIILVGILIEQPKTKNLTTQFFRNVFDNENSGAYAEKDLGVIRQTVSPKYTEEEALGIKQAQKDKDHLYEHSDESVKHLGLDNTRITVEEDISKDP